MSVAQSLGVDDLNGQLMDAACAAWLRWTDIYPEMAVVEDLLDLPGWLQGAGPGDRDRPLVRLAALAAGDAVAAAALAWLLVPGASRIASRLHDIVAEIDAMVAGQLWLEIRSPRVPPSRSVAATILRKVERAIKAEIGMGEPARRADMTWARTQVSDAEAEAETPTLPVNDPDAQRIVRAMLECMLARGVLSIADVQVLASVTDHAEWLGKPLRGRAGLTSPEALEVLTWLDPSKARSMRRHVGRLLTLVADQLRSVDIDQVVEDYPGDDVPYADWVLGLGGHAMLLRFVVSAMSSCSSRGTTWPRGMRMPDGAPAPTSAQSVSVRPTARPESAG
jgi:hypothetical protein